MRTTADGLPPKFASRPPQLDDAEEVAALIGTCDLADGGAPLMDVDEVRMYWGDPARNLADDNLLVIAPDGRIAGYLELYESEPYTDWEFYGYVHPVFTGRGIGSFLVRTAETRARRELHRGPREARLVVETLAWDGAGAARRLLETHGFAAVRAGLQMQIDFEGPPPAPTWPEGITVRRMVPGQDERAIWEVTEEAFLDTWNYSPMPIDEFVYFRIESQADFDPDLWIMAWDGDQVAGAAICRDERSSQPGVGRVSMLAVRRPYRGRGLGLAVLQEAFNEFYQRRKHAVGLAVDAASLTGADRLYRRAGMREVQRSITYEKELRSASEAAPGR